MGDQADRDFENGMAADDDYGRPEDDYVFFKGASIVRATDRAFLVKLKSGRQGWMPKSVLDESEYAPGPGPIEIAVKDWFAEKMQPGGEWGAQQAQRPTEYVDIPGAFILRETAKAIQVKIDGQAEPLWFPITQIDPKSPVLHDGDPKGILRASKWIAGGKGFGKASSGVDRTAQDDIREPAKPKFQTPDPDDDIPF